VLSRKIGERLLIGENIAVTVVKSTSGGVRLGIEAPSELSIIREELVAKMAAGGAPLPSFTARMADVRREVTQPAPSR
jgi:carbon storage regulator